MLVNWLACKFVYKLLSLFLVHDLLMIIILIKTDLITWTQYTGKTWTESLLNEIASSQIAVRTIRPVCTLVVEIGRHVFLRGNFNQLDIS